MNLDTNIDNNTLLKKDNINFKGKLSRWYRFLLTNKGIFFGSLITFIVIFCVVFAPLVTTYDPLKQDITKRLTPPMWQDGGSIEHILGTDSMGRDLLTRIIYGGRFSLLLGLTSVLIALMVGTLFGLITGYYGGFLENILMRIVDIQLGFPFIILVVIILSIAEPTFWVLSALFSLLLWPGYARVVRSILLSEKSAAYVLAAKSLGASDFRIIIIYIARNIIPSMLLMSTMDIATIIITEAMLGFVGLGTPPPAPTWGNIMADGKNYISTAWWVITFPGVAIWITLFGINLFGDNLQQFVNPKLRKKY
ncbi:MAG: ABC transporter permease [Halanaerobiales bacterium]|nr:ABC transporter permease [Halanaerobiales bacterium]